MANPTWTPATPITQDHTVIIDLLGNVQQCSVSGVTGTVLPLFGSSVGLVTPDGTGEWTCIAVLSGASLPEELVGLPPPRFVNDADGLDPRAIVADMVLTWEVLTGRPLYPAQIEQLLVNLYAYREALTRNIVQYAGQQSLVAYSDFPNLDYLGALVGVTRLPASGASCTLEFTLIAGVLNQPYLRPAGTLVGTQDGAVQFGTQHDLVIPAGQTSGQVTAVATAVDTIGNGYDAGKVSVLLSPDALVSVANVDTTTGGAPLESTDALRLRIQRAPNKFSVAGPTEAYEEFAKIDATISQVRATTPAPGRVTLTVLGLISTQPATAGTQGTVPQSVLDAIAAAVSGIRVRPVCDTVEVVRASELSYSVDAIVTLRDGADVPSTEAALSSAATSFALRVARSLRSDVVPEEWIAVLGSLGGVYRVQLSSPAFRLLAPNEWANCTGISFTLLSRDGALLGQVSL